MQQLRKSIFVKSPPFDGSCTMGQALLIAADLQERQCKEAEMELQTLAADLRRLVKRAQALAEQWSVFHKTSATVHESWRKIAQLDTGKDEKETCPSLALTKFAEVSATLVHYEQTIYQEGQTEFCRLIHEYITNDIEAVQKIRKRTDKARRDWETAYAKVQALRAKHPARHDAIKLFAAEKEMVRLQKAYFDELELLRLAIEVAVLKKNTDIVESLADYVQAWIDAIGGGFSALDRLTEYMRELFEWCGQERMFFEEGQKRRAEEQVHQVYVVEEVHKKEMFVDVLSSPDLLVVAALIDAAKYEPQLTNFSVSFVRILEAYHRTEPLLQALVTAGLAHCGPSPPADLFAATPLANEVVAWVTRLVGRQYLQLVVLPLVNAVLALPVEVDFAGPADRILPALRAVDLFLATFETSVDSVPAVFRNVCAAMAKIAQERWGTHATPLSGLFFISKVVVPCLTAPVEMGLLMHPPPATAARSLAAIGRLLETLASVPGPAYQNDILTSYIAAKASTMARVLRSIEQIPSATASDGIAAGKSPRFATVESVDEVDLPSLQAIMRSNYNRLGQFLVERNARSALVALSAAMAQFEKSKKELFGPNYRRASDPSDNEPAL